MKKTKQSDAVEERGQGQLERGRSGRPPQEVGSWAETWKSGNSHTQIYRKKVLREGGAKCKDLQEGRSQLFRRVLAKWLPSGVGVGLTRGAGLGLCELCLLPGWAHCGKDSVTYVRPAPSTQSVLSIHTCWVDNRKHVTWYLHSTEQSHFHLRTASWAHSANEDASRSNKWVSLVQRYQGKMAQGHTISVASTALALVKSLLTLSVHTIMMLVAKFLNFYQIQSNVV